MIGFPILMQPYQEFLAKVIISNIEYSMINRNRRPIIDLGY